MLGKLSYGVKKVLDLGTFGPQLARGANQKKKFQRSDETFTVNKLLFSENENGFYYDFSDFVNPRSWRKNLLTQTENLSDASWIKNNSLINQNIQTYSEDFNNTTWTKSGAVVQKNNSNFSQDLTQATWAPSNLTISTTTTLAPNKVDTARLIYPTSTGSARRLQKGSFGGSAGIYNVSIYAKFSGVRWIYIFKGDGSAIAAWFDIQNGVVGTVVAGYTASIQSVGDGWYRCSLITPSVAPDFYGYIGLSDSDNSQSVTTSGTNGVYLWGFQVSNGATLETYFATTYLPTPILYPNPVNSTNAAQKITPNTQYGGFYSIATRTAGTYTVSVWLRVESGTRNIDIGISGDGSYFKMSTVTVTSTWQRFSASFAHTNTSFQIGTVIQDRNASGFVDLYVHGVQLEYSASVSPYVKSAASATQINYPFYDGRLVAQKLIGTFGNALHAIAINSNLCKPGRMFTASFYVKAAEYSKFMFADGHGNILPGQYLEFNLATGTVIRDTGGISRLESVGDGWYRCIVTFRNTSFLRFAPCVIGYPDGATNAYNGSTYTGDGYSGILLYGFQLEESEYVTDYQKITNVSNERLQIAPLPYLYDLPVAFSASNLAVTDFEQPVGVILDKSKNLVLGDELVFNGNFDGPEGWIPSDASVIFSNGTVKIQDVNGNDAGIYQVLVGSKAGKTYRVEVNVLESTVTYGSAGFRVAWGTGFTTAPAYYIDNLVGKHTAFITAPVDNFAITLHTSLFDRYTIVDSISVREVLGNHALQSSGGTARPILRARYNLLTYSEQFENAAWIKGANATITSNSIVAPDGTLSADTHTSSGASDGFYGTFTNAIPLSPMVASIYLKQGTVRWVRFTFYDGSNGIQGWVDTQTATAGVSRTIGSGATLTAFTVENVGNGWVRAALSGILPNTTRYVQVGSSNGVNIPNGDSFLSGNFYVWGAQLVYGTEAGKYQWIAEAPTAAGYPTYDTVGFAPYLDFDGTDDWLVTNPVDLRPTDRTSVFATVRKTNDTNQGVIVESSTDAANAFTSYGKFTLSTAGSGRPKYIYGLTGGNGRNLLTYGHNFDNAAWNKAACFIQTNLLTYSNDFENWSTSSASVVPKTDPGPFDGSSFASRIVGNGTGNPHFITQTVTATASESHTASVYVKQGTDRYCYLYTIGRSPTDVKDSESYYDLQTGTRTSGSANSSITSVGNGWYRITQTTATFPSSTQIEFRLGMANAPNVQLSNASGYILTWGAQLVRGANTPGNYRATTNAAAPCLYPAPDGSNTAQQIFFPPSTSQLWQFPTTVINPPLTTSLYLKADANTSLAFGFFDGNIGGDVINITANTTWQRFVKSRTAVLSAADRRACWLYQPANQAANAYIWGGMMETGVVETPAPYTVSNYVEYNSETHPPLNTDVISVNYDLSSNAISQQIQPRVDGVIPTTTYGIIETAGSGYFSNNAIYIGRRGGTSLPFNGRMYSLIVRDRETPDAVKFQVEKILATAASSTTYTEPVFEPSQLLTGNTDGIAFDTAELTPLLDYWRSRNKLFFSQNFYGQWGTSACFIQTNLLNRSEEFEFTAAAWSNDGLDTITLVSAPDGTTTARALIPTVPLGDKRVRQPMTITGGLTYTYSVYAKAAGYNFIRLEGVNGLTGVTFNLSNGTITNGTGGAVESLGNGWYRCSATFTQATTTTSNFMNQIRISTDGTTFAFGGNGTSGVHVWRAQLVRGSVPGNYTRTYSTNMPCLYSAPDGTITAMKLAEDATTALHTLTPPSFNLSPPKNGMLTLSAYLKAGERTFASMSFFGSAVRATVYVNLTTGAITEEKYNNTLKLAATSENAGNGWWRIRISFLHTSFGGFRISTGTTGTPNNVTGETYAGDGSSGIYVWGVQLEYGANLTPYAKVTSDENEFNTSFVVPPAFQLSAPAVYGPAIFPEVHPVAAVVVKKAGGYQLGPELVPVGNFSNIANGTDPVTLSGWSTYGTMYQRDIQNGKMRLTANAQNTGILLTVPLVANKWYMLTYDYDGDGQSSIFSTDARIGGWNSVYNGNIETVKGKAIFSSSTTGNVPIYFRVNVNNVGTGFYSNISIKEVINIDVITSTSNSLHRPIIRTRYNLFEQTDTMSNAYWTRNGATTSGFDQGASLRNPYGGIGPLTLTESTNNEDQGYFKSLSAGLDNNEIGKRFTFSIYAKKSTGGRDFFRLYLFAGGNSYPLHLTVNLTNGAVNPITVFNQNGNDYAYDVQSVGDGWYRIFVSYTVNNLLGGPFFPSRVWFGPTTSAAGTGTDAGAYLGAGGGALMFIQGAQFVRNRNNERINYMPYQRVTTSTFYEWEASTFTPHLVFDGVDDRLIINNVNLFNGANGGTLVFAARDVAATNRMMMSWTSNTAGNVRIGVQSGNIANVQMSAVAKRFDANNNTYADVAPFSANTNYVATTIVNWDTGTVTGRYNGQVIETSQMSSTGSTENTMSYGARIGAIAAATDTLYLPGSVYGFFAANRALSNAEIANVEAYYLNTRVPVSPSIDYIVADDGSIIIEDDYDPVISTITY